MIKQQYIIDKKTKRIYKVDEVYVADSENIVIFTKNGLCLPINQIKVNPSSDDIKDSIINGFSAAIINNISEEDYKLLKSRLSEGIPIKVSIFTFIVKLERKLKEYIKLMKSMLRIRKI